MMKVLGAKRVFTLVALFLLNAVLAGSLYYVVIPQRDDTQTELNKVKGAISNRRTEIATLKAEYDQIQQQKALFGELEQSGFFNKQDRIEARHTMDAIQSKSKVLAARYTINAVEVVDNPLAAVSDHVILHSPVNVTIDALDDMDIYSFMYWIENSFPGNASISNVSIERKADVEENALKQIGNGVPVVLVTGAVNFSWNTMVPRSDVPQAPGQQPPAAPQ